MQRCRTCCNRFDADEVVRVFLVPASRVAERVEAFVAPLDLGAGAVLAAEADFQLLPAAGGDLFDQAGDLVELAGSTTRST